MKARALKLLLFAGSLLVGFSLCEGLLLLLLDHPGLARRLGAQHRMHWLYMGWDRTLVQFDPACARYDAELFYTLRPGKCLHTTREFANEYRINSVGVRDTEEALRAPEVLTIGDSFTMGWGVDQDARFSALLAKATGYRVLNTGIASYGTVREMRMLSRIDFSHVKFIVIQYDDNDFHENANFRENHSVLKVHDQAYYRSVVNHEAHAHSYYWGKYTVEILRDIFSAHADGGIGPLSTLDHGLAPELFLFALQYASRQPFDGVQIILWDSRGHRDFLHAVDGLRQQPEYPAYIRNLKVLDFAPGDDDYYLLDDHLNARGHAEVAAELARAIGPKP
jgi:hypothetical protein